MATVKMSEAPFGKVVRRRHWEETLPRATDPELIEYNVSQWYAHFRLEGYGVLRTSWEWEKTCWVLVRMRFRKES